MNQAVANDVPAVKNSHGRLHWYHWLVIGLSLMLTLGAFKITERQVQLKSEEQFEFQSQQILDLVQERMAKYEEALLAGVSSLRMFPSTATRSDWLTFADSLDIGERFPGINGIGVIHYVPPEKLEDYLAWQRESMPGYNIHPAHNEDEYWPITYIEPEITNTRAVGLDMAHEQNRFTAAKKARDTGKANITGPITLVQDAQQTPGFLFYAPWYADRGPVATHGDSNGNFMGLVYAPFIMFKLMDGTLANTNRLVNFSIHDGDVELYNELNSSSENYDPDPLYTREETLELYGRPWRFNLQSTQLFRDQQTNTQPFIILAGGITIEILIIFIFIVLARSNKSAIAYADRVTKDLRAQKNELESVSQNLESRNHELVEANKELDQFAFVASHDLKAPLRGINQLALWIEEDLKESLTPQTKEYLDLLQNRTARLEKLLNDLLAYSRVGRKEGEMTEITVSKFIDDIFSLLSPPDSFKLDYKDAVGTVTTMSIPLELILRNLMSNAIKHHDKQSGTISVVAKEVGTRIQFSVTDDGPGIPPEHQERVFDLFHTLKPRDQVEGSGLGLSVIKKTLDRYNCQYRLISDGQRGCTFEFDWPFVREVKE
ncbi:histidine kinase [Saccharospirillum sp. MSK14-1]|uniref:CHASE domain-containing protein n=1 Tax=Saccharospirillum sp. MSK14-1 TaxID=1897632 RepID=UPI000D3A0D35|nr:CHASE domain-containing protein [Saccharospirillum sp. MSK14-1]PTY36857.1 histidine kinase [Saccharospirillum sp. MSK14-1]